MPGISESAWSGIGKCWLVVFVVALVLCIPSLWQEFVLPSGDLVADITPVQVLSPFTRQEIAYHQGTLEYGLYNRLMSASLMRGFVTIDIQNRGSQPAKNLHVLSRTALIYGLADTDDRKLTITYPDNADGITLGDLEPNATRRVYIWTGWKQLSWSMIDGYFTVSSDQGFARIRLHLPESDFAAWIDQHDTVVNIIAWMLAVAGAYSIIVLGLAAFLPRNIEL